MSKVFFTCFFYATHGRIFQAPSPPQPGPKALGTSPFAKDVGGAFGGTSDPEGPPSDLQRALALGLAKVPSCMPYVRSPIAHGIGPLELAELQ